jgi:hypothetical protein
MKAKVIEAWSETAAPNARFCPTDLIVKLKRFSSFRLRAAFKVFSFSPSDDNVLIVCDDFFAGQFSEGGIANRSDAEFAEG